MIDEVQTGNGRTGELYAYMHFGITPDVVTTAKGLGGGLPIGACLLGERVEGILGYGDHGSTFGGNPAAAAGAVSILSRIDEGFLAAVKSKSERIRAALAGAKGIRSVSGLGLMVGIETVRPAAEVVADCIAEGVLCLTAKTKVRLLPALNMDDAVLDEALSVLLAAAAKGVEE
jgi:acetylornithine/N-succinyldiaminopimelate aminotransferase